MPITFHTTSGTPFTVDEEDAPFAEQFEWQAILNGNSTEGKVYAISTRKIFIGTKHRTLRLKALIMGHPPAPGLYAVSINEDPFCLEKSNLAWLDASTLRHWSNHVQNPHGYRGVSRDLKTGMWQISSRYNRHGYRSAQDAAIAYDQAVRETYGPWARVNFPSPEDRTPTGLNVPPVQSPLLATDGNVLHVDPEYLPILGRHRWHPGPEGYWTSIGRLDLSLATLILQNPGPGGHPEVKWIDGDTRNCTRDNLKWHHGGKSSYIGVFWGNGRWLAILCHQRRSHRLGLFDTPEEAAHAYDRAAKDLLGSKARLNFPENHEDTA